MDCSDRAAARISALLTERRQLLSVAESCTGGLIGAILTSIPGSSMWFRGGVIAYSNEVKEEVLGVDPGVLRTRGAVSRETAEAMAAGVMRLTGTDFSLAVTGIAGPKGGSPDKPVGTVWMAVAWNGGIRSFSRLFTGGRNEVRSSAAEHLLFSLAELLEEAEN